MTLRSQGHLLMLKYHEFLFWGHIGSQENNLEIFGHMCYPQQNNRYVRPHHRLYPCEDMRTDRRQCRLRRAGTSGLNVRARSPSGLDIAGSGVVQPST